MDVVAPPAAVVVVDEAAANVPAVGVPRSKTVKTIVNNTITHLYLGNDLIYPFLILYFLFS
jgi:hypothetical protein